MQSSLERVVNVNVFTRFSSGLLLVGSLHHSSSALFFSGVQGALNSRGALGNTFATWSGNILNRFWAYFVKLLSALLSGVVASTMLRGESQNASTIPREVTVFPDPVL